MYRTGQGSSARGYLTLFSCNCFGSLRGIPIIAPPPARTSIPAGITRYSGNGFHHLQVLQGVIMQRTCPRPLPSRYMSDNCPICQTELRSRREQGGAYYFECPRCGPYSLSREANTDLVFYLSRFPEAPPAVSHVLYKLTEREEWAQLSTETLRQLFETAELPKPQEQLDNLILWLGQKQPVSGHAIEIESQTQAAVGVADETALGFICAAADDAGLAIGLVNREYGEYLAFGPWQLSFKGWARFDELQRGRSVGRLAFMAMAFGHDDLDQIYRACFIPAVAAAGFQLKRLDEGQPAGLIDDHLRVEIRQARFLLADLTHQNRGAYWEAGFAEGLGKPVIYTCRKDAFDGGGGTHFDTNHHLTVIWEPGKEEEAAEKLKATIRATLPDEATQSDSLAAPAPLRY